MENYLINPLWIYLIDVCTGLEIVAVVVLCIMAIMCLVFGVGYFLMAYDSYYDEEDSEYKMTKQGFKVSIILTIISAFLVCVIPSEKTLYTMFVASYITEENLNGATETVTDVVDYIFEKVDELQGE